MPNKNSQTHKYLVLHFAHIPLFVLALLIAVTSAVYISSKNNTKYPSAEDTALLGDQIAYREDLEADIVGDGENKQMDEGDDRNEDTPDGMMDDEDGCSWGGCLTDGENKQMDEGDDKNGDTPDGMMDDEDGCSWGGCLTDGENKQMDEGDDRNEDTSDGMMDEGDDWDFSEGELNVQFSTYDALENPVEVQKYTFPDGSVKSKVSVYNVDTATSTDVPLKNAEGEAVDLRIQDNSPKLNSVVLDGKTRAVYVSTNKDNADLEEFEFKGLKIRPFGESFILSVQNQEVKSVFPIAVDTDSGEVFVMTPSQEVKLGVMPDVVIQKAAEAGLSTVFDATLETTAENSLEFKIVGAKNEEFLGLLVVQVPTTQVYSANTGDLLRTEQTFVQKLLDIVSY